MIDSAPLKGDLYQKTNEALLIILKKSILQEKRDISKLLKKEKSLKDRIGSETERIAHHNLQGRKKGLNKKLKIFHDHLKKNRQELNRKERLLQHTENSLAHLQKEIENKIKEGEDAGKQLAQSLFALLKKKREETQNARKDISLVSRQIALLDRKKETVEKDLERKEQSLTSLQELETKKQERQKQLDYQKADLEKLGRFLLKKQEEQKILEKALKKEKEELWEKNTSKKREVQALGKEIKKLRRIYKKKEQLNLKRKKSIKNKIKNYELKKTRLINRLETDNASLNKLQNEVYALEKKLVEQEKVSQVKNRLLLEEIKNQKKEIRLGQARLDQIDTLLKKIKDMSLENPLVVKSINKEKDTVRAGLALFKEEILKKSHEANTLHNLLIYYKKDFSAKKRGIDLLQRKRCREIKVHQESLDKINLSLAELQKEIKYLSVSDKSLKKRMKNSLVEKQSELSRRIDELSRLISAKQIKYQKDLAARELLEKKAVKLSRKIDLALKKFNQNRKALEKYNAFLSAKKRKYLSSIKKGGPPAGPSSIEEIKKLLRKKEEEKLALIRKGAQTEYEKKKQLYLGLKKKRDLINLEIINKKSQLSKQQKELRLQIDKLKERKKQGIKKIALVKKDLPSLKGKLKAFHYQIDRAQEKKKKIEEAMHLKDQHLKELETVVKKKIRHLKEKDLLRKEVQQINAVIYHKLIPSSKRKSSAKTGKKLVKKDKIEKSKKEIFKKIKTNRIGDEKEMVEFLKDTDHLLGKLPPKEIERFSKSKGFHLYKKILAKYHIK